MTDEASNIWDDVPEWGDGVGARRLVRDPEGSLGNEELLIVLRGQPTIRMHDGDHELAEGDVVPFPRGPLGGHQIRNDGSSTARVLIVAANADPDVAEYPETGKVAAVVDGKHRFHRVADAVDHAGPE